MRFKAAKAAGKLDEQLALGKVTCLCGRMFASQTRKATHTTKCAEFQRWSRNRKTPGRLRSWKFLKIKNFENFQLKKTAQIHSKNIFIILKK